MKAAIYTKAQDDGGHADHLPFIRLVSGDFERVEDGHQHEENSSGAAKDSAPQTWPQNPVVMHGRHDTQARDHRWARKHEAACARQIRAAVPFFGFSQCEWP